MEKENNDIEDYEPVADRLAELEAENNLYKTALNFVAAGTLELFDDIVWESSPVSEQFKSEFLDLIEKLKTGNEFPLATLRAIAKSKNKSADMFRFYIKIALKLVENR